MNSAIITCINIIGGGALSEDALNLLSKAMELKVLDGYAFIDDLAARNRKDKVNFNDFSEFLEGRARETATPISGQFELTPLCNLDCKMCYVHLQPEQLTIHVPHENLEIFPY